jgi:uncharacterized membrane protein
MKTATNSYKEIYHKFQAEQRYILMSWNIVVILASLIGDSIILIGTIRYKAIKQHVVIVAIIQHMAVADLLQTVFKILPNTLSIILDRYILGKLLCHVEESITQVCTATTMFLTCGMTTFKLIIIRWPLRCFTWTSKLGHMTYCAMWLLVLCVYTPIWIEPSIRETIHFSYNDYSCNYYYFLSGHPAWVKLYCIISISIVNVLS